MHQLDAGRLDLVVAAHEGGDPRLITRVQPASRRLGGARSVHDLFVSLEHRRGGIALARSRARALLDRLVGRARAYWGACAPSLRTDDGNGPARAHYACFGFRFVEGLDLLSRSLE